MAQGQRLICTTADLAEAGEGIRFQFLRHGVEQPAFVVRWKGQVRAYLNRCGHVPIELDWQPGEFFDYSRLYLICSTHGALYDPSNGACLGGRCEGRGLVAVPVEERDGGVYVEES
ncbi:MAG: Rieske 2Fe-2S domain-containing protein [Pseudomonadota bacterium]